MQETTRKEIFELFLDEFAVESFHDLGATAMLKTLLIYKMALPIETYQYKEQRLDIVSGSAVADIDAGWENTIFIGGDTELLGENYYDPLISGFVNNSIKQDAGSQFSIYLDNERGILQITNSTGDRAFVYNYTTEMVFIAIITKLLPWIFGDLTVEQRDIVKKYAAFMIESDARTKLDEAFDAIVDEHGLLEKVNEDKLKKLGSKLMEQRTSKLRDELRNKESRYEDYMEAICDCQRRILDIKRQLSAIEMAQGDFENPIVEVMDFLKSTPYEYSIDRIENYTMFINYRMPMTIYSEDSDYESHIKNNPGNSYFFDKFSSYPVEDVKAAYKRIMEDRDCVVWVSGQLSLNFETYNVYAQRTSTRPHSGIHPHLNGSLTCFGTAEGLLRELLMSARMFEFMNQVAVCTQQFTIHDSYAGAYYCQGIRDYECIECPDGEYRNFDGLIYAVKEGVI